MRAGHRAIGLGKLSENTLTGLLGNAHPGIRDLKPQRDVVIIQIGLSGHLDHDTTAFGKLDRIVNEVQQDLTQPAIIADKGL